MVKDFYEEGYVAGLNQAVKECPYAAHTLEARDWTEGYEDAQLK